MPTTIQITAGKRKLQAQLNDSPTAQAILKALPIRAEGNRWGGGIYFNIPVKAEFEPNNCRDVLEAGELGYWPIGSAFCIFFGRTPASKGSEIRTASAVTVIGHITEDVFSLRKVKDGAEIVIDRVTK